MIVVSDHGDEFWEHGDVGHAQGVYQELVHIPLIIRAPGRVPGGPGGRGRRRGDGRVPDAAGSGGPAHPAPAPRAARLLPLARDEVGAQPARGAQPEPGHDPRASRWRATASSTAGPARIELYDEIEDPARAEGPGAGTAHRAATDAQRVRPAVRLREPLAKRAWGTAANVTESFYSEVGRTLTVTWTRSSCALKIDAAESRTPWRRRWPWLRP